MVQNRLPIKCLLGLIGLKFLNSIIYVVQICTKIIETCCGYVTASLNYKVISYFHSNIHPGDEPY